MFMSKKDKLFYKKCIVDDVKVGRNMYLIQWLHITLVLLNFVLGFYSLVLILAFSNLVSIYLYLKTRNEFCKKIETEIIIKILQANIEEYAKETKQHIKIAEYKYFKDKTFFERDYKMVHNAIDEFYNNL